MKYFKTSVIVFTVIISLAFLTGNARITRESTNTVAFNLKGGMGEDMYSEFSDAVYEAGDGGTIKVNIDSTGGLVVIGNAMINLAKAHHIRTECTVDSGKYAMSMAAIFLLHCDSMKVHNNALILFHQPYYIVTATAPNGQEIENKVRDTVESLRALRYGVGALIQRAIGVEKYAIYLVGGDVFISGLEFNTNMSK